MPSIADAIMTIEYKLKDQSYVDILFTETRGMAWLIMMADWGTARLLPLIAFCPSYRRN